MKTTSLIFTQKELKYLYISLVNYYTKNTTTKTERNNLTRLQHKIQKHISLLEKRGKKT